MSKGFFDNSDPNIKPGDFPKCDPGTYAVNGIEFIKKDGDFPVYAPDNYKGLVARLRFTRVDGGVAPVWSPTPVELVLLVKAFGGDVKKLPKDRTNTQFLVAVEDQIKASNGTTNVKVKEGGWVNWVEKCTPPEGLYKFRIKEIRSLDGTTPVRFQADTYGEQVRIIFLVDGNSNGKPTPYDGFEVPSYFPNPFDGSVAGRPKYKLTQTGGKPTAVVKLERLVGAYCPELFDYDWNSDPLNSDYGINEADNPIAVIADRVVKNGKSVLCQYRPTRTGNMTIDLNTLVVEEDYENAEEDLEGPDEVYVKGSSILNDHFNLCEFAQYIYVNCPEAFVKVPVSEVSELVLSDAGKAWANKNDNLANLWLEAGIELKPMPISQITEEVASKLMEVIRVGKKEFDLPW